MISRRIPDITLNRQLAGESSQVAGYLTRGSIKPNWIMLVYMSLLAGMLCVTLILASVAMLGRLLATVTGRGHAALEYWLLLSAIVTLGALPWPLIVLLGKALVRPVKPVGLQVQDKPTGQVTVVLTALDEEEAIEEVVGDFARVPEVAAVVVVDNGSTDRTIDLARKSGAHVLTEARRGFGHVCKRGLEEGLQRGNPVIVLCEGDMTFRALDLEKLMAYLRHADLVMGARTHPTLLNGSSQLNSFFILGNVFVAKILQLRYWDWTQGGRVRLTDVGCTYLAIRAEALRRILPALEVGTNHFLPHLIMVALEHGLRIVQVPVTFWKRAGVSKGGNASWRKGFALGLVMTWHILTHRVRYVPEGA